MVVVHRTFWINRIKAAWKRRSLVWLSGVRRVGKTVLSQTLDDVEYFDCELPRVRRQMEDPESFLGSLRGRRIVLDEVHRLRNPSELLKIAADHFPEIKVLATGSSTLQASARFRDTLTGRKEEIWLTPMMSADLVDFGSTDIIHRMRHGGLPPFFLSRGLLDNDFQEWMDSYWAKDIQELFRLERRWSFQRFAEFLIARSGGIFDAMKYAAPCEISRTTVTNYLGVLEATRVAHVIRPFSTHRPTEIVLAPKVYGFDTGFVCYYRGWHELRPGDMGTLWEHYVLNEMHARMQGQETRYWRDKRGHEVDFVLARPGQTPIVVECKWSAGALDDLSNIRAFRRGYPGGPNWIVAQDVDRPYRVTDHGLVIDFIGLDELNRRIEAAYHPRLGRSRA